jgi:hypothetical protein
VLTVCLIYIGMEVSNYFVLSIFIRNFFHHQNLSGVTIPFSQK